MYESEAKESLKKQEKTWNDDAMVRQRQLNVLMEDRVQIINDRINESVRRQQDAFNLRETHNKAVDDCNQRLKELMDLSRTDSISNAVKRPFVVPDSNLNKNMITKTDHFELSLPKFGRKKIAWT